MGMVAVRRAHADRTFPTIARLRPPPRLGRAEGGQGHVVSVCLPARDEAGHRRPDRRAPSASHSSTQVGLVDEILVVDDHSTDGTARDRRPPPAPGCVAADDVLPELRPGHGKGEALWKSVLRLRGRPHRLVRRRHPRLRPRVRRRPARPAARPARHRVREGLLRPARRTAAHGGGRVTELVARPIDRRCCSPHLAVDRAAAGRRVRRAPRRCSSSCRSCRATASTSGCSSTSPTACGTDAIAQVDLGMRVHRNRPLDELVAPGHSPCSRPRSADRTGPRRMPATLVRPDLEPVEVGDRRAAAARRGVRLPPPDRLIAGFPVPPGFDLGRLAQGNP